MKNLIKPLLLILAAGTIINAAACNSKKPEPESDAIGISREVPADSTWKRDPYLEMPEYDLSNPNAYMIDFRNRNISKLDLSGELDALLYSDFNTETKWPDTLPQNFDPEFILENGRNPGLSVKSLHQKGIDGSGVSIAVIDTTLYTGHSEYKANLKHYEEIPAGRNQPAEMHGSAIASISVGKSIGVAPKADLYYIGSDLFKEGLTEKDFRTLPEQEYITFIHYAASIRRLIEINKQLPADNKIRAIIIARGFSEGYEGYDEVIAAIEEAKEENIFIISTSMEEEYGFAFAGLDRDPLADPDDIHSYTVGVWQQQYLDSFPGDKTVYFPMDSRTIASWTGDQQYEWGRNGGWSWVVPYIGGVYALSAQVRPDITPDEFWALTKETASQLSLEINGSPYQMDYLVNPAGLIEQLQQTAP